jgi:ring-1,2-phenylacetyl-CoA epoxidase subunit PaaE
MALHFRTLTIREVKKETADCVTISFDVPQELKQFFDFTHGQNVTLKTIINGEEVRRSYSICSAPYENRLTVAVKKAEEGIFSTFANEELKAGMTMDVLSPSGKFNTVLKKENKKKYVAFAAGSGITPIISIIKTTLATEPESTFSLVYNNRSRNSIIFFEELEALKNKYMRRFQLIHILSRERMDSDINFGRITNEKLDALSKLINYRSGDEFFICGPEEMIFCVKDFLLQQGVNEKNIHFELFAAVKTGTARQKTKVKEENKTTRSIVRIKLDGRSFEFETGFDDTSILDAALKAGADLPFACKGGVCCTCKAKLLEGKVEMDVHWGLEEEEVKQGYVLTCQSHPLTEKVVIDFDSRS